MAPICTRRGNLAFNQKPSAAWIFLTLTLTLGACSSKSSAQTAEETTQAVVLTATSAPSQNEKHISDAKIKELKGELFSGRFTQPERCAALEKLRPIDLIAFFEEINSEDSAAIAPCQEALFQRISDFFELKRMALNSAHAEIEHELLNKCSDQVSPTFGPEQVKSVNTSKGGYISGSYFPRCLVNLTFDDGPHPVFGPLIVQILKSQNVHANFFSVGQRVLESPQTIVEEYKEGNVIGTHSWSHPNMPKLSFNAGVKEIDDAFNLVANVLHINVSFFRFPYGASTKDLRAYLTQGGRTEFTWNIDTLDWKIPDPVKLFRNALKEVNREGRGVILMHETQPQTVVMLPFLLEALRNAGYKPLLMRPLDTVPVQAVTTNVP